jgi:hypothetical protein
VPQDYGECARYHRLAANQDFPLSQLALGAMLIDDEHAPAAARAREPADPRAGASSSRAQRRAWGLSTSPIASRRSGSSDITPTSARLPRRSSARGATSLASAAARACGRCGRIIRSAARPGRTSRATSRSSEDAVGSSAFSRDARARCATFVHQGNRLPGVVGGLCMRGAPQVVGGRLCAQCSSTVR